MSHCFHKEYPRFSISFAPPLSVQYQPKPDPGDTVIDRYCAWNLEGGHQWFEFGQERMKMYIWYDDVALLEPDIFWPVVRLAISQGERWIHLTRHGWKRCKLLRRYGGPLHLPIPWVHGSFLQVEGSFTHHVQLVRLGGALYVHKWAEKLADIEDLQSEVEKYIRLLESPYVHPPRFGVRSGNAYGILMPYFGGAAIPDPMWRWSNKEKIDIVLDLFDAVLDFERRGVVHADLKGANIILTSRGLKLIDFPATSTTPAWQYWRVPHNSSEAAVHNFGKTIWETFVELAPWDLFIKDDQYVREGEIPPIMNDMVYAFSMDHRYKTLQQAYDETKEMLAPFRRKRIGTAWLVAKHERLLKRNAGA